MRVAIHPQTLDLREFRPGMGYQSKGYVIVNGAEGLYQIRDSWVKKLIKKISGDKYDKPDLKTCTVIWPDIVVRALNNIKALVEADANPNAGPREIEHEEMPISEKPIEQKDPYAIKTRRVGRGNHIPRYPDFTIIGDEIKLKVPSQVHVLALEFRKLKAAGTELVLQKDVKQVIEGMNIATKQEPLRIFRYYFWVLVRCGVLRPTNGTYFCDKVVQQCAWRGVFEPWQTVTEEDVKAGRPCTYGT